MRYYINTVNGEMARLFAKALKCKRDGKSDVYFSNHSMCICIFSGQDPADVSYIIKGFKQGEDKLLINATFEDCQADYFLNFVLEKLSLSKTEKIIRYNNVMSLLDVPEREALIAIQEKVATIINEAKTSATWR